jgi:hypothetical protein
VPCPPWCSQAVKVLEFEPGFVWYVQRLCLCPVFASPNAKPLTKLLEASVPKHTALQVPNMKHTDSPSDMVTSLDSASP